MAIKKSKELENGVIIEHHRVVRAPAILNTAEDHSVEVICEEFVNKASKDAGKSAVSAKAYQVIVNKAELENKSAIALAYEKLMLLPEFENAVEE